MNKKGQYAPQTSYNNVHPILIVGIIIFVIPFMLPIIGVDPVSWLESGLQGLGIITILVGGALSIFKGSN